MVKSNNLIKTFKIKNIKGLHARASVKFVKIADSYDVNVDVIYKKDKVPGNSLMSLLMLTASFEDDITVCVSGKDKEKAMFEFEKLINSKFGEY